jgi:hypothetical protein
MTNPVVMFLKYQRTRVMYRNKYVSKPEQRDMWDGNLARTTLKIYHYVEVNKRIILKSIVS